MQEMTQHDDQPANLIGAIDQGTSSTRFVIFKAQTGQVVTHHQMEITRYSPKEGYVEQDPMEIYESVKTTMQVAVKYLVDMGYEVDDIKAIGLSNQRESTIVWDKTTGKPLHNCIVWLDNRTSDLVEKLLYKIPGRDINFFKDKTGLPISTYFSALKLKWLIQNVHEVKQALDEDRLLFGTVDSWLLWKFTGKHLTDVTNASRTLLMDLETLDWDQQLCDFFEIPKKILPEIRSSSEIFGQIELSNVKIPLSGVIGDQQSALIGQKCFDIGQAKVTFGTGSFLIQNIGAGPLHGALKDLPKEARSHLLATVAYKLGEQPVCYALEGSVAIAGAAITWLRDNLELIQSYDQVEALAKEDASSGGVFFVPAFQGLYAPYWDPNATGTIIGLTQFTRKCHLIRATLEGVAYQTNDILSMMRKQQFNSIKIDGGMSTNDLMCQILSDISGWDVLRSKLSETTALGAAMTAGHAVGLWNFSLKSDSEMEDNFLSNIKSTIRRISTFESPDLNKDQVNLEFDIFTPATSESTRQDKMKTWRSAVSRSREWIKVEQQEQKRVHYKRLSVIPFMLFVVMSFGTLIASEVMEML